MEYLYTNYQVLIQAKNSKVKNVLECEKTNTNKKNLRCVKLETLKIPQDTVSLIPERLLFGGLEYVENVKYAV